MSTNSSCGYNRNPRIKFGPFIAIDSHSGNPNSAKASKFMLDFSSGLTPTYLETTTNGSISSVTSIGLGTAIYGLTITGDTIDLSTITSTDSITVSQTGSLTAISATYTTIAGIGVDIFGGIATIKAQVYRAPPGSAIFKATNATVLLAPTLNGAITTNNIISFGSASSFIPVPIAEGDRLLVVFSATTIGSSSAVTIEGNASASLSIVTPLLDTS